MEQKEGDGIVLTIASAIFALYGFKVSCACANEFLATREAYKYIKFLKKLNL
jgi:preprotein translocase subunit SecA